MSKSWRPKGDVITNNLWNYFIGGKKCEKKNIEKSDHTIEIEGGADFRYYSVFTISLANADEILYYSKNQETVVFLCQGVTGTYSRNWRKYGKYDCKNK